ncbi:MAG: hypothetical protein QF647_03475 [SAR324 cluster bacterium]|nr:hypothetical protein [SAR324 cluster bacterium]
MAEDLLERQWAMVLLNWEHRSTCWIRVESTPNASRENFGLVRVQSKGLGMLRYEEWGCVRDECAR